MSNVAIITARGGSKRIPRKNIRPFLGKPIIAYVIDAALQSGLFEEVMVSTDDAEIADVARQYGASVPFLRKPETSGDYASTIDVLLEVLDEYEKTSQTFESLCCLYPTAPFVTADLLTASHQVLLDKKVDIVYPIQAFSFPIQRAFKLNDGLLSWAQPDAFLLRSQDLEPMYHDAGQFYWFNVDRLRTHRQLPGLTAGGIEIDEMHAHDIDTESDWKVAEFKYRLLNNLLLND
ncbi:pseudaminic acid cytidylyltransferase [Spirosoma linguale]|uniref:Pseudaminic acid CMP-transferase n=1 Tax=Spirosoma linguale (strain ATCC 33905 / DSM 74 / LMG 10896 / Claus 1) TaxID=504472 RepID=D2QKT2_SPILD|nr:pseudaminic acid CMP-transferase [Spirosoma linguale DSM 74]